MKNTKSLVAAIVFATASLGSSAVLADDISHAPVALDLVDDSAFFGASFGMNNDDDTFLDQFTFSVAAGALPTNLDAIVSSISRTADTGLNISGLNLYGGGGALVASGTMDQTGAIDVWTLTTDNMATGSYYIQVSGSLVSDTSGSFGGSVMLAPVPEPETYGMLLGGLGLLGFMARRRKAK